jgi:hypothetical protein
MSNHSCRNPSPKKEKSTFVVVSTILAFSLGLLSLLRSSVENGDNVESHKEPVFEEKLVFPSSLTEEDEEAQYWTLCAFKNEEELLVTSSYSTGIFAVTKETGYQYKQIPILLHSTYKPNWVKAIKKQVAGVDNFRKVRVVLLLGKYDSCTSALYSSPYWGVKYTVVGYSGRNILLRRFVVRPFVRSR